MKFACTFCGQHIEADEDMAGQIATCPSCQRRFPVLDHSTLTAQAVTPPIISATSPAVRSAPSSVDSKNIHRWLLLALILFAGIIVYLSRLQLSFVLPMVRADLGISVAQLGWTFSAFQFAYIAGSLLLGLMCCLIGTRWTYGIVLVGSMIAVLITGFVGGVVALIIGRVVLGLASGGTLPAAIQSVSECVPRKVQAIVTAVILCGTLSVSLWGSAAVSALAMRTGWRSVFFVTAGVLFFWLLVWGGLSLWAVLAPSKRMAKPERIVDGFRALGLLRSWLYVVARVLIDPLNSFLLMWGFSYMMEKFHLSLANSSQFAIVFGLAIGGALLGALISDIPALLGLRLATARSIVIAASGVVMLLAAAGVGFMPNAMMFVVLAALAIAAYQSLSVNLYASLAGGVPSRGVGMVVGIGATLSGVLTAVLTYAVGSFLRSNLGMVPLFVLFGVLAFLGAVPAFFVAWSLRSVEKN
jgi:MFS family permease